MCVGGGGGKRHIPPHPAQPRHTKPLGSANAETTPAGAPAAAADRTQRRRNMRRDERVTVQGPVKEQRPDGMSHRGGGGTDPGRVMVPSRRTAAQEGL